MIHSYVIGRGNTATAYLQAGMIRPVPDATADAVVDVQAALGRRVPGEATLSWAGRILTPNAGGKAPQKIYWEGNILNKISKKIVALVTMAAFVLTLVPAAAFAADDSKYVTPGVDIQESEFYAVKNGNQVSEITVDANEAVTFKFAVNDGNGVGLSNTNLATENDKVKIWAVDQDSKKITTAATFKGTGVKECTTTGENVYKITNVQNSDTVTVEFAKAGTYAVYAGVGDFTADGELTTIATLTCNSVVNVDPLAVTTTTLQFDQVAGNYGDGDNANITPSKDFIANGIDTDPISGVAYTDQTGNNFAAKETFDLSTNSDNIKVPASVTTDNVGHFSFEYSIEKAGIYKVYMSNDDLEVTITINASDVELDGIKTIADNAQTLLAGNDKNYKSENIPANFADAVQFEITDKYGDVVENASLTEEPAAKAGGDHDKYVTITEKPEKSGLAAENLTLVWDNTTKAYTLKYDGSNPTKDLIPGEYTVKVGLLSGKTATATFTMEKYGTTKDLVIKTYAKASGVAESAANPYTVITNEIALGQDLKVAAKYVDENGIEIAATKAEYGADGKAVTSYGAAFPDQYAIGTEESLIGTTVYVKAFDSSVQKYAEAELTVVDTYDTYTLAFNKDAGEVNKNNTVEVSVVDEDGNVAKLDGQVMAYVDSQSNKDAKIEIDTTKAVDNGKVEISLFSNKETTADIVVAVKAANGAIYGKTLSYTFGAEDVNANTSVVMTIGSSDMVVNNQVVAMEDAAPYVAKDRTFVPFRALGEVLGAEVEWDNDARTVTYVLGDNTIVMTIDSTTYTVNGEEKTMDVAPEITGERTYVPVRFVGEALGFKVTALYAADGTTASVVFQK